MDDRAAMVLDHEAEEEPIEFRASRLVELLHLLLGEHAGHQHVVLHPVHHHLHAGRIRLWHRLVPVAQPRLHRQDLVLLGVDDPVGEVSTDGLAPCVGAMRAITIACAW